MSVRRLYETTYVINAALEDNDVEQVITRVSEYITNHGGTIQETNKWGRRRLGYPINKKFNGFYVHCIFDCAPSVIPQLDRFFILEDNVLRHLTLQLEEKLRTFRKTRAIAQAERAAMLAAAEAEKTAGKH
ncbi:MAG: 30S ribosomal protein S6 [Candidatus Kapabacteria bacterium]|nr:30S ribosomal protein S6 [Candidatus Kapabacteria bacterium]